MRHGDVKVCLGELGGIKWGGGKGSKDKTGKGSGRGWILVGR